jgi:hypothetical protein
MNALPPVIPSGARNLLVLFCRAKADSRRFAPSKVARKPFVFNRAVGRDFHPHIVGVAIGYVDPVVRGFTATAQGAVPAARVVVIFEAPSITVTFWLFMLAT